MKLKRAPDERKKSKEPRGQPSVPLTQLPWESECVRSDPKGPGVCVFICLVVSDVQGLPEGP